MAFKTLAGLRGELENLLVDALDLSVRTGRTFVEARDYEAIDVTTELNGAITGIGAAVGSLRRAVQRTLVAELQAAEVEATRKRQEAEGELSRL